MFPIRLPASSQLLLGNASRIITRSCLLRAVHTMNSKSQNGTPAATTEIQTLIRDGQEFTEVKEGLARILVPFSAKGIEDKKLNDVEEQQRVFYNPIQQFNRDLTVLAIKAYHEEVLAKRRPFNTDRVAKRKREKSEAGGGRPVKHGKANETTNITASTVDTAENNEAQGNGADIVMPDAQNAQETEPQDTAPDANGKTDATPSDVVANADQPVAGLQPVEEQDIRIGEEKRDNLPSPPRFTILDALSATGLRALRYAQELPFVTSVTANDLSPTAVEAIKRNAIHNGVESKVNATAGDARAHMYSLLTQAVADEEIKNRRQNKKGPPKPSNNKYNVIDLDPYGTAAPFFDAALNAVRDDGGLLCVTCTDSAVFASNGYPEKAFALYGGIPVKGFWSHEAALRLIIHSLSSTAARYGLAVEPLLSLSIDYYVRIFVKVRKSPAQVKFLAGRTMIVYNCDDGCGAWETQFLVRNRKVPNKSGKDMFYKHGLTLAPTADRHCKECGSKMHLAGPMYGGPLHSADFIKKILDDLPNASDEIYGTKPRIEGMLETALEEFIPPPEDGKQSCKDDELATIDPYPFYFHPASLAGKLHCVCPDEDSFRGALRHLGYKVTRSHGKPGSLKTNASWSVIWHIMREWVRQKAPVNLDKYSKTSPAYRLMKLDQRKEEDQNNEAPEDEEREAIDKLEVVFDKRLGRDTSKQGLIRYQTNPKENWGPQAKAKGH